MKLLTNLIFEPKGKHDPALAYTIKDTVMSADGSKVYFAVQDVPANTPLADEDYWKLQIDLSGSKHALDEAAAAFADQVKFVGTRVKGETAKATGNPVSFLPDAGSLLQPVTVLEPQQDGSGDPYPAGGGKNLIPSIVDSRTHNGMTFTKNLDGSIVVNGTATGYTSASSEAVSAVALRGKTVTLKGANAGNIAVTQIVFVCDSGTVYKSCTPQNGAASYTFDVPTDANTMQFEVYSVSGQVATNLTVYPQLELGSESSTYAPYSNIRPFIGYDKLDLNHAGKNLLRAVSGNVPAVAIGDNTVTFVNAGDGYFFVEADSFMDGETVTLSFNVSNFSGTFELAPYNDLSYAKALTPNARNAFTFKYRARAHDGNILIDDRERDVSDVTLSNFQLERCSVATDYAAPVMTDHTVQIGQTVYGGKMDWLTGKLTKIWPVVTLRDLTISYKGGEHDYFEITMPTDALATADFLCETYKNVGVLYYSSMPTTPTGCMGYYPQDRVWRLKETRYKSVDELLAGNGDMKIAYKLATPIEIQLTPHIISAADPEQTNTLYGDGSIEVEYVKPLHVSIEERVAAALAAATE